MEKDLLKKVFILNDSESLPILSSEVDTFEYLHSKFVEFNETIKQKLLSLYSHSSISTAKNQNSKKNKGV